MSYIPSHAMPHAYVHEDDGDTANRKTIGGTPPTAALVIGGAVLGYLLLRVLR